MTTGLAISAVGRFLSERDWEAGIVDDTTFEAAVEGESGEWVMVFGVLPAGMRPYIGVYSLLDIDVADEHLAAAHTAVNLANVGTLNVTFEVDEDQALRARSSIRVPEALEDAGIDAIAAAIDDLVSDQVVAVETFQPALRAVAEGADAAEAMATARPTD